MPSLLLKLLPYIVAVLIVAGAYATGHVKGTASCEVKDADKETTAIVKEDAAHAKIEEKVMALPATDLDKRLSVWLRD